MRVYILALQNRIYFAEKLLEDIKNARIISKPFVDETVTEIATDVKRRIAGADIILAIIDEKSNNSVMFNTELQLALMESRKNRNKMLIPIILDDVAVPVTIEDTLYIKCNSESEEDLEKTKLKIVRMMEHKRYIVKKQKLRENKSRTSSMVILTLAIEVFAVLFIVLLIKEPSFNIGHWDEMDICLVLSNLLENAIEASLKTEDSRRKIVIKMYLHHTHILLIQAENNFDAKILEKNGVFQSTKHSGNGIGIQSIRHITERNGGASNFTYKDGEFTAKIMLRI